MDASETKPASRRARLWARVSDPHKPPQRWWYPPSSRRDDILRMSEAERQDYQTVVQQAEEKISKMIQTAMSSLLSFALFCLLITVRTPDSTLLGADSMIKMPFVDVQVSLQTFLTFGPLILIALILYFHILGGDLIDLEMDYQYLTQGRASAEPFIMRPLTLFVFRHQVSRLAAIFIFYSLMPFELFVMTWKAAARTEWGAPSSCSPAW